MASRSLQVIRLLVQRRQYAVLIASVILLQPWQTFCFVSGTRSSLMNNRLGRRQRPPPSLTVSSTRVVTSDGGEDSRKHGFSAASRADDVGNDNTKKARGALDSMRLTYRWCFANVLANVFITLIMKQDMLWKNHAFSWRVAVDIADSLNLIFFGYGLWKVTKLYGATYVSKLDMTLDAVRDACSTMGRVWRTGAWSILAVTISNVASLSQRIGSRSPVHKIACAPVGVVAIAALGSVVIRRYCARHVDRAIEVESKNNKASLNPDEETARTAGFLACRNLLLCMGSFGLMGATQFVEWVLTSTGLVQRMFSVFNFVTPITIAGLQLKLYQSFFRAVITVTSGRKQPQTKIKFELYDDLYEAQIGFHTKVGETLKSATIFSLLPYLFAPLKPFLEYAFDLAKHLLASVAS